MNTSMSGIHTNRQKLHEAGMVALMVTFIMMIVISLIVLGFSEATRRNVREALDRQLSTQAYYAAESGINDAIYSYNQYQTLGAHDATVCSSFMTDPHRPTLHNNNLDPPNNTVKYTCLLVTDQVSYTLDQVTLGNVVVENLHFVPSPSPIDSVGISWQSSGLSDTSNCPSSAGKFPDSSFGGCQYAILRLDFVPGSSANSASALAQNTKSFYFEPSNSTLSPLPGGSFTATSGQVVRASCDSTTGTCTANLTGLAGDTNYYVRMSTIYNSAVNVKIGDLSGNTTVFSGSQLQVDSTGQAQDQLRRVRVRLPLNSSGTIPVNAVSSTSDLCKRYTMLADPTSPSAYPDYNSPTNAAVSPLCLAT